MSLGEVSRCFKKIVVSIALTIGIFTMIQPIVSASSLSNAKIVINIPARQLWLYSNQQLVHTYPVGVGRQKFPSPKGTYHVIDKLVNPGWENPYLPTGKVRVQPGKNSPLGTRWIGFMDYKGGEYGIHGTDDPSSVGRYSTHGCIRMRKKDVEALYNLVEEGTPVVVSYDPYMIRQEKGKIILKTFKSPFNKHHPSSQEIQSKVSQRFKQAKIDKITLNRVLKSNAQQTAVIGTVMPAELDKKKAK